MSVQVVVFSSFNRALFPSTRVNGTYPCLTEEWITERYRLWKNYSWPSVVRQTFDEWIYVLCCHPDAKAYTDPLFQKHKKDPRFRLSYSFSTKERQLIRKIGKDNNHVLTVRLDSDDMYHPLALEELLGALDGREWYYWKRGFICHYATKRMGSYDTCGTGPFLARLQTGQAFAKKKVLKERSHRTVMKFRPKRLPAGRFMVGITGHNTSTRFGGSHTRRLVAMPMKAEILRQFGIWQ